MFKKYILDAAGDPVEETDLMKWARWIETADRTVARTTIGAATVSTVFLGVDHNYGDGPPILFETMIFWPGELIDTEMQRYETHLQAVAGHEQQVKRIKTLIKWPPRASHS